MNTTIFTIRTHEYLTPNAITNITNSETHLVCIHFLFDAVIKLKQKQLTISSGELVVANSLKITNPTLKLGRYRIVVFQTNLSIVRDAIKVFQQSDFETDEQNIVKDFKNSFDEFEENPIIKHIHLLECKLNDLISMLERQPVDRTMNSLVKQDSSKKIDPRLIFVHRYIRKHYSQPLTLQHLADLINSNPVYLSNTFSKVFRISPMRFLQSVKMQKSLELLTKDLDISIKNIAISLGYVSSSQFSEIFKRYYGQTPLEYRNKCIVLESSKYSLERSPKG